MSKHKANGHSRRGVYKAYMFRTKDPAIDEFRTTVEDHFGHRVTRKDLRKIEEAGGATVGCTHEWFFGKTMRPTNAALEASGRSLGFKRIWTRANQK